MKTLLTTRSLLLVPLLGFTSIVIPKQLLAQVTTGTGSPQFDLEPTPKLVRLRINSVINQFSDECMVVFSTGAAGMDEEDVPKFIFAHPAAPQVATTADGTVVLAINAYGTYSSAISIPVLVNVGVSGNYTITVTGQQSMQLSCLRLEDLATGIITPLTEGASYTFAALDTDAWTSPRMLLHASAPLVLSTVDATCHGRDDGRASVEVTTGPVDIQWLDEDGSVVSDQPDMPTGSNASLALGAGAYSVSMISDAGCGWLTTALLIEEPTALELMAEVYPASCPESADGSIGTNIVGGTPPYAYSWNNGSLADTIQAAEGTYTVTVTDVHGCTLTSPDFVVNAGDGPQATISVENESVAMGEEVTFHSASDTTAMYHWDFGDGTTSDEMGPVHTFGSPGSYMVVLEVESGGCTNSTSLMMTVESPTGLRTIEGTTVKAWVSEDRFVIDHDFGQYGPVLVRILATSGQLLQEHRLASGPGRIMLSNAGLDMGIYLVQVSQGAQVRTFALAPIR